MTYCNLSTKAPPKLAEQQSWLSDKTFLSPHNPASQTTPDTLLQLVSLQNASGCWELNPDLAAALNKTRKQVEQPKPAKVGLYFKCAVIPFSLVCLCNLFFLGSAELRWTGTCGQPFWLWFGFMGSSRMLKSNGSFLLVRLCHGCWLRMVITLSDYRRGLLSDFVWLGIVPNFSIQFI